MTTTKTRHWGGALMVAMVSIAIMSTISIAVVQSGVIGHKRANAHKIVTDSRFLAEGAINYLLREAASVSVDQVDTKANFHASVAQGLGQRLHGKGHLGGRTITITENAVVIPTMNFGGGTFSGMVKWKSTTLAELSVTASKAGSPFSISTDMDLIEVPPGTVNYGVAARGPITVGCPIQGVTQAWEGSVYSGTHTTNLVFDMKNKAAIAGDVYMANPNGYVATQGKVSIAGHSSSSDWADHIHTDAGDVTFPTVSVDSLRPLATTAYTGSSTLNNVYIPPNTNPRFTGNATINGILFVDGPNHVYFGGNCVVRGLIIGRANSGGISNCKLTFKGTVDSYDVNTLPATSEFAAVRTKRGSFIIAQGFDVDFGGNFTTINGTIAADKISFSGSSDGTIRGMILAYGDYPLTLGGKYINIDRVNAVQNPVGLVSCFKMVGKASTYKENPR